MKRKTIAGLVTIAMVALAVIFLGWANEKTPVKNKGTELGTHFEGGGISFDYPKDWASWEKASFDRMRSFIKSQQGADLVVMLKTKDEACIIQVAKQGNPSSFDSFYQSKKEIADRVTTEGMEIMGYRYVKYYVKIVDLPGNQKAVLGYAKRRDGQTAISYQLLSGGYEYDVNFIYKSPTAAAKDEELREQLMRTFKITGTKE